MKSNEEKKYLKEAEYLRKKLHDCPEPSMHENETKKILVGYLEENTSLKITDCGSWFYAVWNPDGAERTVAFRADFDAVSCEDGKCRHLCGHDGHAAVLAVLGKIISGTAPADCKIVLLFQPGEESGEGALLCRDVIRNEGVDEIYGFHNIPGYKEGVVLLRKGTFACASTGLEIKFTGKPAHAAYPEQGINPAEAAAEMISESSSYLKKGWKGMVLSTVVGIESGSDSYGVSASEAVLRMTVRGEYSDEFDEYLGFINRLAKETAAKYRLDFSVTEHERFPSTENYDECVQKVNASAEAAGLEYVDLGLPFRWSEDFGWYLKETKGAFFGIGSGGNCPELHTSDYEYPDVVTQFAIKMFMNLISDNLMR